MRRSLKKNKGIKRVGYFSRAYLCICALLALLYSSIINSCKNILIMSVTKEINVDMHGMHGMHEHMPCLAFKMHMLGAS